MLTQGEFPHTPAIPLADPPCYTASMMVRLCAVMTIFLCACGVSSDRSKPQPRILRVWDWWSPVEGEKMQQYFRIVEETFEREHPGVDVRFQHIPWGPQYLQKVMAGMAAGRPPDCFHASIVWANDLYERGILSDLRPYIDRTPEMADSVWLPAALQCGRDGDYVYGLPIEHDAASILYNIDLFERAGLPTDPNALATWEDFRQAAVKLTKYDASGRVIQAGFMVPPGDLSNTVAFFYSNGGKFYSEDHRRSAFNDVCMRETLQFLQDLQYRDRVSFPIAAERQDFQFFLQGKAAMVIGGTWSGHIIEEQAPNMRFSMMSFPQGPHGKGRGGMTWTNMMCIPKGAVNPDLAWEFLTYYCGMRNALIKLDVIDRNSPLAGFYSTPEWQAAVEKHPSLGTIPEITEVGGPYPVVRFTEIEAAFFPLCQGVMLNRMTPQAAIDKAQQKVDDILKRYYEQIEKAFR